MIIIGLVFLLRNNNNIQKNINSAVQLSVVNNVPASKVLFPYSAINIIVNAAEIISPNEADFSPFNTSNT